MATTEIIKKEIIISLELSKNEALFLKGLTQNSLTMQEESDEEFNMRESIFNALSYILRDKNWEDI